MTSSCRRAAVCCLAVLAAVLHVAFSFQGPRAEPSHRRAPLPCIQRRLYRMPSSSGTWMTAENREGEPIPVSEEALRSLWNERHPEKAYQEQLALLEYFDSDTHGESQDMSGSDGVSLHSAGIQQLFREHANKNSNPGYKNIRDITESAGEEDGISYVSEEKLRQMWGSANPGEGYREKDALLQYLVNYVKEDFPCNDANYDSANSNADGDDAAGEVPFSSLELRQLFGADGDSDRKESPDKRHDDRSAESQGMDIGMGMQTEGTLSGDMRRAMLEDEAEDDKDYEEAVALSLDSLNLKELFADFNAISKVERENKQEHVHKDRQFDDQEKESSDTPRLHVGSSVIIDSTSLNAFLDSTASLQVDEKVDDVTYIHDDTLRAFWEDSESSEAYDDIDLKKVIQACLSSENYLVDDLMNFDDDDDDVDDAAGQRNGRMDKRNNVGKFPSEEMLLGSDQLREMISQLPRDDEERLVYRDIPVGDDDGDRSGREPTDNYPSDVTYVDEETLRSLWKEKNPKVPFNEAQALMLFDDAKDDDDSDDDEADLIESFAFGSKESESLFDIANLDLVDDETESFQTTLIVDDDGNDELEDDESSGGGAGTGGRAQQSRRRGKQSAEKVVITSKGERLTGKSVGIDLGTTFSAVSVVEAGRPRIIPIGDRRIAPSVVAYTKEGAVLVGEQARRQQVVNPRRTFSSAKRLIGRTLKQVRENGDDLEHLNVDAKLSAKDTDACLLRGVVSGNKATKGAIGMMPEEVSAQVISMCVRSAEEYLGLGAGTISRAVITVPAYFLPQQCEATERAGKLAGLERVKLLREPEAAALSYGLTKREKQIVLVFDLGGGTFDVSVLEVGGGFVEVVATSGDAHLGGDDFDKVLVDWMMDQLAQQCEARGNKKMVSEIRRSPIAQSRLLEAAVDAKIALSAAQTAKVAIPFLYKDVSFECDINRRKFESLSRHLLARILKPVREVAIMAGVNLPGESGQLGVDFLRGQDEEDSDAYDEDDDDEYTAGEAESPQSSRTGTTSMDEDGVNFGGMSRSQMKKMQQQGRRDAKAKKKAKGTTFSELRRLQRELGDPNLAAFPGGQQLDEVIMVGGSTRIPAVQRLVHGVTGVQPRQTVNPDEAVSLGAAVMAGIMDGDITDMQVMSAWQAALYRAFEDEKLRAEVTALASSTEAKQVVSEKQSTGKARAAARPASDAPELDNSVSNRSRSRRNPLLMKRKYGSRRSTQPPPRGRPGPFVSDGDDGDDDGDGDSAGAGQDGERPGIATSRPEPEAASSPSRLRLLRSKRK